MRMESPFRGKKLLAYAAVFALGLLLPLLAKTLGTMPSNCRQAYDLINPALRCSEPIQQGEWDYEPLREKLLVLKNDLKSSGKLSHNSVYFRDLDHGPRFGIGEYDQFHPASLLKLPVLIAFLHQADRDPAILEKQLSFSDDMNIDANVEQSDETIELKTAYTIRELLKKMIVYSDNRSYLLLTHELNSAPPITTYYTFRDLDVLRMMVTPNADYISIYSYANLFAVLYNTGYLSKEMSQFALELLSQATFKEGIVAGVPENTRVAHKFGHRILTNEDDQLHDCGIVYHPFATYLLCVMTSGPDFDLKKNAIASISRTVYDEISALHVRNNR